MWCFYLYIPVCLSTPLSFFGRVVSGICVRHRCGCRVHNCRCEWMLGDVDVDMHGTFKSFAMQL